MSEELPEVPYPKEPLKQVKEEVRRHKWGDSAATVFENMRENMEQSRDFAGASAPPITMFLGGFETAMAIAYAWAQYAIHPIFWNMSAADAKKLGDRITNAVIPVIDNIIQAEIEKFESQMVAKQAKADLARANGTDSLDLDQILGQRHAEPIESAS